MTIKQRKPGDGIDASVRVARHHDTIGITINGIVQRHPDGSVRLAVGIHNDAAALMLTEAQARQMLLGLIDAGVRSD